MSRIAMCACGAPLVMTFHWRKKEFYCLDCGRHYTYFGPRGEDETPELLSLMEAYRDEWAAIAKDLLTPHAYREGCEKCSMASDEYHANHATDDERARHEIATQWITDRSTSRRGPPVTSARQEHTT